jgi:uncharacterized protein YndB with AHSA1/START domain
MEPMDTTKISAPIAKVFEYLSDPDKQVLWMDGLVRTSHASPWDPTVGTHFTQYLRKGHKKTAYEFQGEIVAFKQPNLYAIRIVGSDFTANIRYHLQEIDGQTQLDSEAVMEFKGNLINRFLGRMAAHHNKQDMKKLIAILEKS